MKLAIKNFFCFWRNAVAHFFKVDGLVRASALAYTTLLAIVPLSMLGFGIVSAFPASRSYAEKIQHFLVRHFVPASADVIKNYLEIFTTQVSKLSIIGLLFTLVTAVLLIFTIESAFNAIWQIKASKHRRGLPAFLMYWAILTLLPLIGAAAFAASLYVYSWPLVSRTIDTLCAYVPILFIISFAFTWLAFALLYLTIPNFPVKFRHAALGALVAAFFFETMKEAFGYYLKNFSSDFFIYGTLAVIPVFLLWLYLSWIIVIFGAIVVHLFAHRLPTDSPQIRF